MCRGNRHARRAVKGEKGADKSGGHGANCVMCLVCNVVSHDLSYFVNCRRIIVSLGANQVHLKLVLFKVSY